MGFDVRLSQFIYRLAFVGEQAFVLGTGPNPASAKNFGYRAKKKIQGSGVGRKNFLRSARFARRVFPLCRARVMQTGARERSHSREEKVRVFSLSRAFYLRSRRASATQAMSLFTG